MFQLPTHNRVYVGWMVDINLSSFGEFLCTNISFSEVLDENGSRNCEDSEKMVMNQWLARYIKLYPIIFPMKSHELPFNPNFSHHFPHSKNPGKMVVHDVTSFPACVSAALHRSRPGRDPTAAAVAVGSAAATAARGCDLHDEIRVEFWDLGDIPMTLDTSVRGLF